MNLSQFQNKKILITGHTGFKGSWLALWLTGLGAHVYGVSNAIPTVPSHILAAQLAERMDDGRLDIRNEYQLNDLIEGVQPDFVFHLAAQALVRRSFIDPLETWQTNTLGTINVLNALRKLSKPCVAIFITSDKCYDNVEWVWGYRETDSLGGGDPYSASKAGAELAIRSFVQSYFPVDGNIRIGVGRAGNVIGGGDWAEDRIVPDCIRACSQGMVVPLRNPISTRPWQHVLEPLSGYLNLAMQLNDSPKLHGEPFNFGPSGRQNYSVNKLVSSMASYWEILRYEDVSAEYGGPYESNLLKLNCDKALHHLQWHAIWDFDTTVRETILWYRHYYESGSKSSMADYSLMQIALYVDNAREKGLLWAK